MEVEELACVDYLYSRVFKHPSMISKVKDSKKLFKKTTQHAEGTITPNKQMQLPFFNTKSQITELVFNYIVEEMRPIVTCEKPSFCRLIQGLTGITDSTKHICCTADIWSANNKSFMGMTCHFINEFSYKRSSYVLSCRRIKGSHNYLNINDVITDICDTYQIKSSKITHIITDNASNFSKAFRTFSKSSTIESDLHYVGNLDELNSDEDTQIDSDNENNLSSPIDMEYVDVGQLLYESNSSGCTNFSLPDHLTCCAHTLNLIATTDVAKITDTNYINISKKVFSKLSSFWNLLSRSTGASDKVFDICKVKFPVPIITRWNSTFDAIQKVLLFREKLNFVFLELNLAKIKNTEWVFLEEYCKIMQPLTTALDKLQGEKRNYLGFVAPTIIILRRLLIELSLLTYCSPLKYCVISSLEKRFSYLFDLSSPKSKSFIISSMSHPLFKCSWIPLRYIDLCKELFINECKLTNSYSDVYENHISDNSDDSDTEFYGNVFSSQNSSSNDELSTNEHSALRNSNLSSVEALSFLNSKVKELNILDSFPVVKQVFINFNTSIPSSAPVERLFSGAIQILTPRRNRLNDKHFDMLLCCRCYLQQNSLT
ncbi:hypothetical protein QTP88_001199 [Uroleucon formosanum]